MADPYRHYFNVAVGAMFAYPIALVLVAVFALANAPGAEVLLSVLLSPPAIALALVAAVAGGWASTLLECYESSYKVLAFLREGPDEPIKGPADAVRKLHDTFIETAVGEVKVHLGESLALALPALVVASYISTATAGIAQSVATLFVVYLAAAVTGAIAGFLVADGRIRSAALKAAMSGATSTKPLFMAAVNALSETDPIKGFQEVAREVLTDKCPWT